jgi:hypothetical protein
MKKASDAPDKTTTSATRPESKPPRDLKTETPLQLGSFEPKKPWGLRGVRPGVYRFNTHEEADAWMEKKLAENQISER